MAFCLHYSYYSGFWESD